MSPQTLISSRHRFAGDLARATDVAGVLVKYGLAGWLGEINWQPVHDASRVTAERFFQTSRSRPVFGWP